MEKTRRKPAIPDRKPRAPKFAKNAKNWRKPSTPSAPRTGRPDPPGFRRRERSSLSFYWQILQTLKITPTLKYRKKRTVGCPTCGCLGYPKHQKHHAQPRIPQTLH